MYTQHCAHVCERAYTTYFVQACRESSSCWASVCDVLDNCDAFLGLSRFADAMTGATGGVRCVFPNAWRLVTATYT